jgi:hypothetical protein
MGRMSKNVQALPPSSKETSTSKLTAIGPLATEIHIEAASGSTAAEKAI